MESLETWLSRVYAAEGKRDTLDQLYDRWAKDYDEQIWASGNPYIAIQAGMIGRHISDFNARILDAGCGTGNMAQVLHQTGYTQLEGLDPSKGMLEVAKRKGVYQKLHALYLDANIDLEPDSYDAVIASGVLTHGHAPPESLDGILNITKPGGMIIFSLSEIAHGELGFGEKITHLENNNAWKQLDRTQLFRTYPFSEKEKHLQHWVCAYQKT